MANKDHDLGPKGEELREKCASNNAQHFIINEGPNMSDLISLLAKSDTAGSRPKECPAFPFEMGEFKAGHFGGFYAEKFYIMGLMDITSIHENGELKVTLVSKNKRHASLTGYYNFSTQRGILVFD